MKIREALATMSPSLQLQRAAADEIARLDAKQEQTEEALMALLVSFIDLVNGWPVRELHERPQQTIERALALVPAERRHEFKAP